ncbi:MAG: 16S rRNA (cytidine(1402)-2'-O)-methyltransferase [Flavobacteriaceae bacterium]|nr:16S rRNA (cytidine(1402)-2'-O)-methyltransferase [Flavobacteriaceae bacterium]
MAKLYVIPTPIGNLDDITIRAVKTLEFVDIILCEDTRRSQKLLSHLGIKSKLKSHHKFNEHKQVNNIVNKIKSGINIGVISDAGTPGISDPGFLLVRSCLNSNIDIECLPGPTALIPALIISGLPMEKFVFEGFLPSKKGRKTKLQNLSTETRTMIFFESPHKLTKTLIDFQNTFGSERNISVSREITKMYEHTLRGKINEILEKLQNKKNKGEFVIVVDGKKS